MGHGSFAFGDFGPFTCAWFYCGSYTYTPSFGGPPNTQWFGYQVTMTSDGTNASILVTFGQSTFECASGYSPFIDWKLDFLCADNGFDTLVKPVTIPFFAVSHVFDYAGCWDIPDSVQLDCTGEGMSLLSVEEPLIVPKPKLILPNNKVKTLWQKVKDSLGIVSKPMPPHRRNCNCGGRRLRPKQ
jgi:hypothetical protein